jgi:putative ABC transport system permease protein
MSLADGFRRFFRRDDPERDVREEIESHIEMEAEELIRSGVDPATAREEAARRFGDLQRIEAEGSRLRVRRSRRQLLDAVAQDVRIGMRTLLRHPRFSAVAIAVLALGIGGTTAVFSVFNAVVLRPLPYPEPDRLVQVVEMNPERAAREGWPYLERYVSAHD